MSWNTVPLPGETNSVLVPASRLADLKIEIAAFAEREPLNNFQRWIVKELYEFSAHESEFEATSILLLAIPNPLCAKVRFHHGSKTYACLGLVMPDFAGAERRAEKEYRRLGYNLREATNLPLKRLAVQSGLAVYGRNNICYVDSLGSSFCFKAYWTDRPPENMAWGPVRLAPACEGCGICTSVCPTKAIREDRFLIDNQLCLSALNEVAEPFPEWLPLRVHHTLYDCLRCQMSCPMNREHAMPASEPIEFDAAETELLLTNAPIEAYPASLQAKAAYLGLRRWPAGIARNMRAIIQAQDS
jgi:epoxyqueuosine reductase